MGMLNGTYEHCLDQKNRLRLPAKLKAEIGVNPPTITKGSDNCIYIYPAEAMDVIFENLKNRPITKKEELKDLRIFTSSMFKIEEDNQGRFTLSSDFKKYAKINKDVVFIGVNNRIELWSKESWNEYNNDDDNNYDELLMKLSGYGV